jgi:UDP-2-acetamido-2,6-beta-L-arabino-hexul-4-ose reductase
MATTILVTGARGFVGRNLCTFLRTRKDLQLIEVDLDSPPEILKEGIRGADIIFHLAGVNRPCKMEDYASGNWGFTKDLCHQLRAMDRAPAIIFSSSIQAESDNPYGASKLRAEEELMGFAEQTNAKVVIFRLKNVFGKWCRPNYNSVVATFCYNIAHGMPISISDAAKRIELVYVDDVCAAMEEAAGLPDVLTAHLVAPAAHLYAQVTPVFEITLGELADTIRSFRESRHSLKIPAFDNAVIGKLYATYLSYLDGPEFVYELDVKADPRGHLAEYLKSPSFGQIFISRTKPGITRGNHYHHTKTEKFLVVQGNAVIRFRHILESEIIEHRVRGEEFRVVDIPPGYTHSITNIGDEELVTLFWANEVFDPERPDTYFLEV